MHSYKLSYNDTGLLNLRIMTQHAWRQSRSLVLFVTYADGRTRTEAIMKTNDHVCQPWPDNGSINGQCLKLVENFWWYLNSSFPTSPFDPPGPGRMYRCPLFSRMVSVCTSQKNTIHRYSSLLQKHKLQRHVGPGGSPYSPDLNIFLLAWQKRGMCNL